MSHYFESPQDEEVRREITATIWDHDHRFLVANGVFSASRLDPGTSVLFRVADPPTEPPTLPTTDDGSSSPRFLDLGCGFGPIAIALATECPRAQIDAVDVNQRALDLTTANAARAGVSAQVHALTPEQVPATTMYDEIWSNPPIRIGKQPLHDLLTTWFARLKPSGKATLVVGKNLGADSLHSWLESTGWKVTRLGSSKGFRVLEVSSSDTPSD